MAPRLTPLAESLPASVPFVGPEAQERTRGAVFQARIGANESVFGPSPRAIEAMAEAAKDAWKYPDPENFELKAALAAHHDVPPEAVVVGEGIDGLLGYAVRLFAGPGDAVVTSDGAYPTFNYHVAGFGADLHKVPYRNDHEDPEALVAKAHEVGAKLVYLSNPDNPMGTWLSAEKVSEMAAALPSDCLFLLDEAYVEFAPEGTAPPLDLAPNVLRIRTFSKAYGMAGARVGYGIAHPDIALAFNKVRNHFGMTRIAQAGALAALADQAWLMHVLEQTAQARTRIAKIGAAHGLSALPSATNFVTLDCGQDGDYAHKVLGTLINQGIFVRMPFVAPQDRCIRVGCGTDSDLELFESSLPRALDLARA